MRMCRSAHACVFPRGELVLEMALLLKPLPNSLLWFLHRPYCLTMLTSTTPGIFSSSPRRSPRHQHTSVKKFRAEKRIPGLNECPQNCLCSRNIEFSYKNPRFLSQFVSSQTGMILPRNITKLCMKKQRKLARTIKRARHMGFMPYTYKQEEYLGDEKLF